MVSFKELELDTNYFQKPVSYSKYSAPQAIYEAPIKTLQSLSKQEVTFDSRTKSLRIYVNGEAREDLDDYVLSNLPSSFSELEKWAKETFRNDEFLIILNRVEKWHDPIVKWCGEFFQESDGKMNEKLLHLEVTYFIGNTTYTPFGVHIDEFSDALHLNLGPNKRYMYLWNPELYKSLRGSAQPLPNPGNNILSNAEKHLINPFEWFFLPASRYYHVGENKDFSVSLAFALLKYDDKTMIERVFQGNSELKNRAFNLDVSLIIDNILNELKKNKDGIISFEAYNSTDDIEEEVIKYILKIRSNAGFRVPTSNPSEILFLDFTSWKDAVYSISRPFRVLVLESNGDMHIFARGNRMSLKRNESILDVIRTINSGEAIDVFNLIEKLGDSLSEKSLYTFFEKLYQCGVLKISDYTKV